MSIIVSEGYLYAFKAETAYASGKGSNAGDCTPFAAGDKASLTSMPFPQGEQEFPQQNYERVFQDGASIGPDTTIQFVKGIKYGDLTIKQFVQDMNGSNDYWLDDAFQALTMGSAPSSWVFHLETDDSSRYDVVGCVISEYTLELTEGGDFLKETIKFMYYDIMTGNAVTDFVTTTPFITTRVPKTHADFKLSIDGDAIESYLKSCTLTIKFTLEDMKVAGRFQRIYPYCKKRECTLKANFYSDQAAQGRLPGSQSANEVPVVVSINGGTNTWTISKMRTDDSNANKVPEMGIKPWDIEMKNSGACTYTKA